ncbi:MAG: hypothetical protein WCJ92_05060 [Alphaproteobacteria bacterium]
MNIKLLKLGVSMGMLLSIDIFAADLTVSAESSPCFLRASRSGAFSPMMKKATPAADNLTPPSSKKVSVDASKRNTQVEDLEDPWIELMRTHE